MSAALELERVVADRRIVVCCGSGGVGKTTTGAALGVLAAQRGRSALVMTIDPAHRLAQAMGLEALGHEPSEVAVEAPGRLSAMMLDTKHTFDGLVDQYAPSDQVKDAIFANEYYRQLSSTLGGSRELVAMERVLESAMEEEYDLLIVDTPPAHHALDFLDAPRRLIDLIDGSLTNSLLKPYGMAARAQFNLFRQSSAVTLKFLERLTGFEMLADLSEFLLAFSSMFDGFKERSHRVMELMREPGTTFLLICAPQEASLDQVEQFRSRLAKDSLDVCGVLVNRVHLVDPRAGELDDAALARIADLDVAEPRGAFLAERVAAAYEDRRTMARADAGVMAKRLVEELPVQTVPHFHRDLHSMADLKAFAETVRS